MRLATAFTLTLSLWACSDLAPVDDDDPGGGDDPGDGGDDPGGGGGDDLDQPAVGFQIETPDITIEGGQEVTYCYYTTLPNQAQVGVKKWESMMTPGSHHMILYFLDELPVPSGTLDTNGCGLTAGDFSSVWTYAAGEPRASSSLPDGVGMAAEPGSCMPREHPSSSPTRPPSSVRRPVTGAGSPRWAGSRCCASARPSPSTAAW